MLKRGVCKLLIVAVSLMVVYKVGAMVEQLAQGLKQVGEQGIEDMWNIQEQFDYLVVNDYEFNLKCCFLEQGQERVKRARDQLISLIRQYPRIDLEKESIYSLSPVLTMAAMYDDIEFAGILLDKGADIHKALTNPLYISNMFHYAMTDRPKSPAMDILLFKNGAIMNLELLEKTKSWDGAIKPAISRYDKDVFLWMVRSSDSDFLRKLLKDQQTSNKLKEADANLFNFLQWWNSGGSKPVKTESQIYYATEAFVIPGIPAEIFKKLLKNVTTVDELLEIAKYQQLPRLFQPYNVEKLEYFLHALMGKMDADTAMKFLRSLAIEDDDTAGQQKMLESFKDNPKQKLAFLLLREIYHFARQRNNKKVGKYILQQMMVLIGGKKIELPEELRREIALYLGMSQEPATPKPVVKDLSTDAGLSEVE